MNASKEQDQRREAFGEVVWRIVNHRQSAVGLAASIQHLAKRLEECEPHGSHDEVEQKIVVRIALRDALSKAIERYINAHEKLDDAVREQMRANEQRAREGSRW